MHRHELAVLNALRKEKVLELGALLKEANIGRDEALWAIENLANGKLITVKKEGTYELKLSDEGGKYAGTELPEQALVKKLVSRTLELSSLSGKDDQIALMWAKRKGLISIKGRSLALTEKGKKAAKEGVEEDGVLKELSRERGAYAKYRGSEAVRELEKRGLVETKSKEEIKEVRITQLGALELTKEKQGEAPMVEALDRNAIRTRSWAGKNFSPYNVEVPVERADAAVRHPLRRTIDELREAYVGLGFTEVSGPVIEPAFWVFDYLFVPQDHPARDVQDTFFLGRPKELEIKDKKLMERIRKEHEMAWHGEWSEKIAMQAVARTHTTSVTGRYINEVVSGINSGKKYELPLKFFTIGRNLRNENIDPKHTADFYQHDGIVIGKNLTLANLFDTLIKLYKSLGIDNVRFKPYYYPFVEPGALILGEFDGGWLELGGAGVIRKEITGIARSSINVLAWGPGVERILLVKKKIKSITELYGSSAGWLREMSMM